MKRFSAQYIISATGQILKRGIISTTDDGLITGIKDTGGSLEEEASVEYHNGIIVPGFVNCHTHLELSDMKGSIEKGGGLGQFVMEVREKRNPSDEKALKAINEYDRVLYQTGTSAVADICNTPLSFDTKTKSKITYINLLEIFGIDPARAGKRIGEIKSLLHQAQKQSLSAWIVPHSAYSISGPLFKELKLLIKDNELCSIHFLESQQERQLIKNGTGQLMDSYLSMGITTSMLKQRVKSHLDVINSYIPGSCRLILVHNTFAGDNEMEALAGRENTWWCLCPRSNLYIENVLPPIEKLLSYKAPIVIGTDSLASNNTLNILDELIMLQSEFPHIALNTLIMWACRNGAEALNLPQLGTIEVGKTPGLVLIEDCDLGNLRLLAGSKSKRLI